MESSIAVINELYVEYLHFIIFTVLGTEFVDTNGKLSLTNEIFAFYSFISRSGAR